MIAYFWSFSFGFITIHIIWSFWINISHFRHQCLKFLIFQFDEQAFGFLGHHIFFIKVAFPFSSQILVCTTAFAAHYLFSFWDLHLLSSLCKKNKRVGRYIGTSLCNFQDQQNQVCMTACAAHYLFLFWDLHLLSSLSKKNKK